MPSTGNTLQQILGYVTLSGLIKLTTDGIPNPFPAKLFSMTRNVIGDSCRYTQVTGQRQTSRLAQYGAPAVRRQLKTVASRDAKLLHTFEEQPLPPLILQQLRNYDNYDVQQLGKEEVARQVTSFGKLFENLRIAATAFTLSQGAVWFDSYGNLLPTSSGAFETVSFNVDSSHQGQLNYGGGNLISTSWGLLNADIPGQIRALKFASLESTGYEIKVAFYGRNVPSYMTQNQYVLDYLARTPAKSLDFLNSGEIGELFGITWIPTYTAFFNDQNDASQKVWDDDLVVFAPEPSGDWWETVEGSYLVPTTINMVSDAAAALASMKQVYGKFGYGQAMHNPPGITTFGGDTFLPILKNPDAIWQATVKF